MNTNKLFKQRKKKGYSQEDLANICGVSRQAVSKWETGQTVPDSNNLLALSRALDVSIDYLLDNESEKVENEKEFGQFSKYIEERSVYEYKSKRTLSNIPLVHIHHSRSYGFSHYMMGNRKRLKTAKGIIAIGDKSIGVISIGFFSLGILNIGILGLGFIGLAVLQLAIFSFGIISVGLSAVGIIAFGMYALGIVAIAKEVAVGIVAIGDIAIGIEAFGKGVTVNYKKDRIDSLCELNTNSRSLLQHVYDSRWLPQPLKSVLRFMLKC